MSKKCQRIQIQKKEKFKGKIEISLQEWLESTKSEDEMVKSAKSLVREQNWLTMFGTLQIVEKTS